MKFTIETDDAQQVSVIIAALTQYENRAKKILISDVKMSVRTFNILSDLGIRYIGDLADITETKVVNKHQCGDTTLCEIKNIMRQYNVNFRAEKVEA